jgi:pyruvate dehydrogenase E2 component (dihydrolipoamide acetyltransferase)
MTVVEEFTAIINPPQAAILAVGTIRDEVVVGEGGGFKAQKRLSLTLSCDHRVIDGMMGAQFLTTVLSYLENPLLLLA